MKNFIADRTIPYKVDRVLVLTVRHDGPYTYVHRPGRSTYTFNFTRSGCMEYHFPELGVTERVTPGQAIFIPEGICHNSTYMEEGTEVDAYQFNLVGKPAEILYRIHRLSEDAASSYRLSDMPHGSKGLMTCVARIYEMLGCLQEMEGYIPRRYRRLQAALEEIEREPAARHSVAYYADLCYMSESGFRRAFRECTGQSPIEYRNTLRLHKARTLILCGEYSVEEAAALTGFTNLSFFYRLFKRTFGEKPGEL